MGKRNIFNTDTIDSPIITGNLTPSLDNVSDIGSSSKRFKTGYFTTLASSITSFITLALTATLNQVVLGTGNKTTISAPTPGQNQIITLPDSGVSSSSLILSDSASGQTINSTLQVNNNLTTTGNVSCNTMTFNANGDQIYFGAPATNIIKTNRILMMDYSGLNRWVGFTGLSASSGSNRLFIGGGSGAYKAATSIEFWTAALTTTNTGTNVAVININGLTLNTGDLTVSTGGLFLPTSGGTASALNYYEETSVVASMTGAWTGNITFYITRKGRCVTLSWADTANTATSAAAIGSSPAPIAARFRNTTITDQAWPIWVQTAASTWASGTLQINFAGSLSFYPGPYSSPSGAFTSGASVGIKAGTVSWTIF
jgi:hypothetical protein